MTTLDDKLLGEKTHYYCSSDSEPDDEELDEISDKEPSTDAPKFIPSSELNDWEGSSTNTGPKGVIKDWQRYKQLESERREEQELERLALMKKLSLTCQSSKDEEKMQQEEDEFEKELEQLLDDKILEEFKMLHMQQLMNQHTTQNSYGKLYVIKTGQEYLDAIDKTEKGTLVIMYIYAEGDKCCRLMYDCFASLAADYQEVKFCGVEVSIAGLSRHFERKGVPAVLVYKNGSLIGNFVRLTDELDDEFVTSDIENYLLEHGMLPDHSLILTSLRKAVNNNAETDSD